MYRIALLKMDKSKTILREGYVYREEKLHGLAEVLYCVLKPNTLCFHRRKVHKRHTPLGLLKLEELVVDINDYTNDECSGESSVDCNHNLTRFPWKIVSGEQQVFLYCASLEDRIAWLAAIEGAKKTLTGVINSENFKSNTEEDCGNISEGAKEQSELASKVKGSVDNHQLLTSKSVYNSSDTTCELNNAVRTEVSQPKTITRIRSHSFSEVEKPNDLILDNEQHTRYLKSKSAPPDNGKRACKTVDKLIHSGLCRQFVRWI